nr:hypothetical protein [Tanacetum cinerariifolium]
MSSQDTGFKSSNDVGKKVNEVPRQENKCKDQEEKDIVNSTNKVNVVLGRRDLQLADEDGIDCLLNPTILKILH